MRTRRSLYSQIQTTKKRHRMTPWCLFSLYIKRPTPRGVGKLGGSLFREPLKECLLQSLEGHVFDEELLTALPLCVGAELLAGVAVTDQAESAHAMRASFWSHRRTPFPA